MNGEDEIALTNLHAEDDGLALPWTEVCERDGAPRTAFVNPPFNRNRDWVQRCAEEAARGMEIILLIPARTDTRYWQRHIASTAQAVCFWRGRITFVGARHPAPFPCAFVYWGPRKEQFQSVFREVGQVVFTENPVLTEGETR